MARVMEELVDQRELLDFSQTFGVARSYMGSALFQDRKTQYVEAEYYRLCRNGNLPTVALVHAYDTEAHIGSRIPLEKVENEQLLIKEKINQTEELRKLTRGMRMDNVRQYVFDDIARTAEKVVTRVEAAKMEALSTGKMTVTENHQHLSIDYHVPTESRVTSAWGKDADIIGDVRKWRQIVRDNGYTPTIAITTDAVVSRMMNNAAIQKAIFGVNGTGILPTLDQINALMQAQAGITIRTNEDRYGVFDTTGGTTTIKQKRFWPEDVFVMVTLGTDGTVGTGLWGVTPEEEAQGTPFDSVRQQQFVTVTQWSTPDPVAVWTKASGVFIPVLPNPYGMVIANVAEAAGGTEG